MSDERRMAQEGGTQIAMEDVGAKLFTLKDVLQVTSVEIPEGSDNVKFKAVMLSHLAKVEKAIEDASEPNAGDMFLDESQKEQLMDKLADITATLEQRDFKQKDVLTKFVKLNNLYRSFGFNE